MELDFFSGRENLDWDSEASFFFFIVLDFLDDYLIVCY